MGIDKDSDGFITIAIIGIIAGVSLLSAYLVFKPAGEGIGNAFTLFGNQISLYIVIGLTLVSMFLVWLIFGKSD